MKGQKEVEKIVMRNSPDAAQVKTVTGWVSRHGRFFGNDESQARYDGCTHDDCDCGNIMSRGWTKCDTCRQKKANETYEKMPFIEWDGETPVYDNYSEKYFFSIDDIESYLEDFEDDNMPELQLVLCVPNSYFEVEYDYWADIMPDDSDGDLPSALEEKLKELNQVIKTLPPASWEPGKIRTKYIPL